MSTRSTIAYWPTTKRGPVIHIYHEMLNDRLYLDIGTHSYNRFCIPIAPAAIGRATRRRKHQRRRRP